LVDTTAVYEGDLGDGIAIVPMTAAAGVAVGFDWLLVVAVVIVLATVIVYRRRGPRRDLP
jgi:cell division protein FtsW (lipid II flippase)